MHSEKKTANDSWPISNAMTSLMNEWVGASPQNKFTQRLCKFDGDVMDVPPVALITSWRFLSSVNVSAPIWRLTSFRKFPISFANDDLCQPSVWLKSMLVYRYSSHIFHFLNYKFDTRYASILINFAVVIIHKLFYNIIDFH